MRTSIVLLILALHGTNCYPNGPPLSTCLTRFPKHNMDLTWTKSGPCPFSISLSQNTYSPRDQVTLTIEAKDGTKLKGIQLSAHRKSVNVEEFVGSFVSLTPADKLQTLTCMGVNNSQVAHKKSHAVSQVVVVWQAPAVNVGDIIFKATFVKSMSTFWALETKHLDASTHDDIVLPDPVVATPVNMTEDIDFSGCGSAKGCFLYPRQCQGADCYAAVTYKRVGETYEFEMLAQAPGYVVMGLSDDKLMGGDQTFLCTAEGGVISVQSGFNPGYFNFRTLMRNLTNLRVKKTSSRVMCKFTRPRVLSTIHPAPVTIDLSENWYILLAWGYVATDTDVMAIHVEAPAVSDNMVDFQTYTIHRGSALTRDVRAHGSLMVVAWVLLSGLAGVIARHYKDIFKRKVIYGAQIWFQLHRGVAVTLFLFTLISFAIMFIKLQEIVEGPGRTHAVIGIAVGVALVLQMVGGLLRPNPDAKLRPMFKFCHTLMGYVVRIIAAATIYLGFSMETMPKLMQGYGATFVPAWIGVQVIWEIALEAWTCRKGSTMGGGDITLSEGMALQIEKKSFSSTNGDYIVMGLYLATLLVFTVVFLCGVNFY